MQLKQELKIAPRPMLSVGAELVRGIGLLKLRNVDLDQAVDHFSAVNPFIRVSGATLPQAAVPAAARSIYAHVEEQIGWLHLSADERRIANLFVEHLEPSGWLGTSVAEIARMAGLTVERCNAVLVKLQEIEPSGMFARNLAECLELQARDRGILSTEISATLAVLEMAASGGVEALARASGLTAAAASRALRTLRTFDPKPGSKFDLADPALLRAPDLIVTRNGLSWQVELNPETLPRIEVVPCPDNAGPAAVRLAKRARAFAEMVKRRNRTLHNVARTLVEHQSDWLRCKVSTLAPFRRIDLARTVGLHETTVCRVCAATTAQTPRGTLALAALFSRPVGGSGHSRAELRARVCELIRKEPSNRPLSDAFIADQLTQEGIPVARRSIARHRADLGIPSRSVRRVAQQFS